MTEQQTFTIDQLAVSPLNVRFNEEDCKAVDALAASIVEEGLIHGLTLHTIEGEPEWARLADGTWASTPAGAVAGLSARRSTTVALPATIRSLARSGICPKPKSYCYRLRRTCTAASCAANSRDTSAARQ